MHLYQWLTERGITDEEFALSVPGVTAHAVKKWRYRERLPKLKNMIAIEDLTLGSVTLRDWPGPIKATYQKQAA